MNNPELLIVAILLVFALVLHLGDEALYQIEERRNKPPKWKK